jgi:hypothetical protein
VICVALLAGCQTTGQNVSTPANTAASPPAPTPAAAQAAAPPAAGAVSGEGEARSPAGGQTAVRAVRFNAEEFVGYGPERVLPVLGAPDFVRRDGTAQIWQYRATNCILDLFLYTSGKETRVKHAELRPRTPGAEGLDSCYSRMRQERGTQPTG